MTSNGFLLELNFLTSETYRFVRRTYDILYLPLQTVGWPSHFEELRQVLILEPSISYPSSHINEHVSLVTRPLQVIRPLGGSMIASQGSPVTQKETAS